MIIDWEKFKQEIKDSTDDDLVEQIAEGIIIGIDRQDVTRDQARRMMPILSSDNPTRIWTKTQLYAMSHKGSMEEAIAMYENALLPAAQAALVDQMGQLTASGNICTWPPSPFAASWVSWCVNNLAALRKVLVEKVYNLNGYKLWQAGEVATGIIKGSIAVKTTYEGGQSVPHYYPEKNWH